jgi:hypothetical protein
MASELDYAAHVWPPMRQALSSRPDFSRVATGVLRLITPEEKQCCECGIGRWGHSPDHSTRINISVAFRPGVAKQIFNLSERPGRNCRRGYLPSKQPQPLPRLRQIAIYAADETTGRGLPLSASHQDPARRSHGQGADR